MKPYLDSEHIHKYSCEFTNKNEINPNPIRSISKSCESDKELLGNCLKISFKVGFYALIIPFKFKTREFKGSQLHTNIFQQVLCGLFHILLLYQYFTEVRTFPYESLGKEAGHYFTWFQKVVSFLYHIVLVKRLWKDRERFLAIVQYLETSSDLPAMRLKIQSTPAIYTICIFYILMSTLCQVLGYGIIHDGNEWSPQWLYRRYAATARTNFLFSNRNNWTYAPELDEISSVDTMLIVITFLGYYFRILFAQYSDGMILMICLTLWAPSKALNKMLESSLQLSKESIMWQPHPSVIIRNYKALKGLSSVINDVLGSVVLTFMLDSITFYSTNLNVLFVVSHWLWTLRALGLFVNAFFIMFICGDICKQVEKMQEWLSQPSVSKIIGQDDLILLLNDVRSHQVSISGRIFVVDYSTIFNVTSTLVTYFIICSQNKP